MAKKNTLGRGLESLFLENDEEDANRLTMLRLADIEPNPKQPRKSFDDEALASLADSISRHGLLQPIAVRESMGGFYQIIAGERRWRAAKLAGLAEVPAIIYTMDDRKAAELALIENIQREDLNPIEEAKAIRSLINDYGLTQEEASRQLGRSRSALANTMRLLELPEAVIDMVARGDLSAGHARTLLSLTHQEDILILAERILSEELSVRATELAAKAMNALRAKEPEPVPTPEEENDARMASVYLRSVERRACETLGRRLRILEAGNKIEISYEGNEDLEELLRLLCGDTFFRGV